MIRVPSSGYSNEGSPSVRYLLQPRRTAVTHVIGAVIIVALIGACGSDDEAEAALPTGSWRLTEVAGEPASAEAVATIDFVDSVTVSGTTGCNSFQGSSTVDGDSIDIGPLAATRALCVSEELNAQEVAYLGALDAAATWSVQGGVLVLSDAAGSAVATFDVYAPSIVGAWTVTGYNTGSDAVTSVILGTDITLQFSDDATVAGNASCNEYSGPYTVDDDGANSISIGPVASTERACLEPAGVMDQELQFLAALDAADTWQFAGDRLELRGDDGALQVSATPVG